MLRHPDEEPSPRRSAATLTKPCHPDDASSPRQNTAAQTKCRHPELDSGSVKAPPLCYKSFASGPVEEWSLHSQRSVKRLVEGWSLSLSKNRHFFANKPLRLIQLSSPTKLMTRLAKKNFTRTKSCHPDEIPSPRRNAATRTKPCYPDKIPPPRQRTVTLNLIQGL